jgi:translation initiation factor 1
MPDRKEDPAQSGFPRDGVVRVSRTSSGRKGKTVTLVHGLPAADLRAVASDLKRLCGSGGAVKDGVVEIQGDHRERIAEHLGARHTVKLAGG